MRTVCQPVVAGSFYPADPATLSREISGYLSDIELLLPKPKDILGAVVPHAGYLYSGKCAAYSFKALSEKDFDLAVIIAPSHQYGDFYYSVGDYDAFATPLGEIEVDRKLTQKLLNDSKFVFYPYAHEREHSLEVQIPFLQIIKPEARILPLLIGYQYEQSSRYLSGKLAELFRDRMDKTVFIISSDLSHYHNRSAAETMDRELSAAIEELAVEKVELLIKERKSEACGFGGILTIMNLAKVLDYPEVKTLKYTHSGKTSGDNSQVVGYLSSLFYRN
jgi:hypothetical protein